MVRNNMESPRVTVLLSVYNSERYLNEAIISVLAQTFTAFELLVVDDHSTDGTLAVLRSYDDPRVRVILNDERIGLTPSLNKGLSLARGEYIARMDADDVSLPARLGVQVKYLDMHPDVGLISSDYEVIDSHGIQLRTCRQRLSSEEIYYRSTFSNCIVQSSVMFRKELVLDAGGYDETLEQAEDSDLWNRISRRARIDRIPTVLLKYREHCDSLSQTADNQQLDDSNRSFTSNLAKLMGNDSFDVASVTPIRQAYREMIYTEIRCSSIRAVETVHQRLVTVCPPSLDAEQLKAVCDERMGFYLWLMVRNMQGRDVARVLRHPQYKKLLAHTICLRIKRFLLSAPVC